MKTFFIIPILIVLNACDSKKNLSQTAVANDTIVVKSLTKVSNSDCPPNGKCTVEWIKNKSLEVKTDDFGSIYYEMNASTETSIIKYQYARIVPKGLQDGHYREEIVFEINNNDSEIKLYATDLQKTKMLFGRFCFCRGSTGNYKITDGNLKLKQTKKEVIFTLDFKNNKVPQLIQSVSERINI